MNLNSLLILNGLILASLLFLLNKFHSKSKDLDHIYAWFEKEHHLKKEDLIKIFQLEPLPPERPRRDYKTAVYIKDKIFLINDKPEYLIGTVISRYQNFQGDFILLETSRGGVALRSEKCCGDGLPEAGTHKKLKFESNGVWWDWKIYVTR